MLLALLHALQPIEPQLASAAIAALFSLLPAEPVAAGEHVRLNPSLEYIACNVMLCTATKFPPNSAELAGVQDRLGNRWFNVPCYLFLGESQCGVVEVARGNLSVGCVRVLMKLHDVMDVVIVEQSNRTLQITVIASGVDEK